MLTLSLLLHKNYYVVFIIFCVTFFNIFSSATLSADSQDREAEYFSLKRKTRHAIEETSRKKRAIEKVMAEPQDVFLKKGKGSKGRGGGKGEFFWKILFKESVAGKIFINSINGFSIGSHASIQIFLNKASQGKQIGRIALTKACLESTYNVIYAHMRKNNIASYKSALSAGFREVHIDENNQRTLRWDRGE